jgi:type I restriction enzyme, S subunit
MIAWSQAPIEELVSRVSSWDPASSATERFTYVDLSAVDQQEKRITAAREMSCLDAPSRARQLIAADDILVSTVRPNLNGVARVPRELDGATASTGFCVLRPRTNALDAGFLFHWVKGAQFISELVRLATGANYPAVSERIVRQAMIPLPPLKEQRRIAAILDQAEALKAKRKEAIAKLDALAQSIFFGMFGDPVTNPKSWPEGSVLGDISEIVSGVTKGRKTNGQAVRSVAYMAVSNVQDGRLDLSQVKTIDATDAEVTRYRLQVGDLLLTEGGDPDKLGRGTLWRGEVNECIHQNHVFRVRVTSNRVTPRFLSWLVGSSRGKAYFLRSAKQTTGIASINMTQLRAFPLLLPPITLQNAFETRLQAVEDVRRRMKASFERLDDLFLSIQDRAFRGAL